jgi:flagellar hook-associated protein 2
MGTVGLNFGSATSGDGFNVSSTVAAIVSNQSAIENPWNTELTSLEAQDTALSSIGTDLSTLSNALQSLTDFEGVTTEMSGSTSDGDVVTLTAAGTGAVAGTHTIVVSTLAQTSSVYTDAVTASDTLSGNITIQVGTGTTQTVTVDSSSDTLATLASAINSDDIGVKASVISDNSGSRLELVSATGGSAGDLTIGGTLTDSTTSSTLGFSTAQAGQDATFSVDGINLTSGSNTITTAIPGVTFQLLSAAPTESVQVEIVNDNTAVESAFESFVSAFNTVVGDLTTQEGNTTSGSSEPLYGTPIIAQLQTALSQSLSTGSASGSIANIEELGITVNNNGTLSLDVSTLDSVLNSNYSDVVGFMQNSGSFGSDLTTTLSNLANSAPYGAIYLQGEQNSAQESTLKADISSENVLISEDQSSLTTELNTANEELQAIPTQLQEINEVYSALSGYNESPSG